MPTSASPARPGPPPRRAAASFAPDDHAARDAPSEGHEEETPEERVFVVAPTGRDGPVAERVLAEAQIPSTSCERLAALPADFPAEAGALLLTEEAVMPEAPDRLAERLDGQPEWARLPVVLLTGEGRRSRKAQRALRDACASRAHVTTLERPLRASTLTAMLQTALRQRARQRDVGRLLSQLEEKRDILEDEVAARTEALRKRKAQVRSLAEALTRAEQRERQRLSRVLHDHLQQLLYGMKVHAQMLRAGAPGEETSPGEREGVLDELDAVADEAIELTRTLSIELNPPVLAEEGLRVALDWLATQMRERHGLDVTLETPGDDALAAELGEELRALLFRLVRELLFNVVKHAETDHATVTLRTSDATPGEDADDKNATGEDATGEDAAGRLAVTVADDGCGFDPAAVRGPSAPSKGNAAQEKVGHAETGLGLFSVRERVALFGGDMTLQAAPGDGTRVTLTVPV
jgi:signal transduction histidine kinase